MKFLFLLLLVFACGVERHDLTDTDPVFYGTDEIIANASLSNKNMFIPSVTTLNKWSYADYYTENANVNHYFEGGFNNILTKISFGWPSKNKYARTSSPVIVNGSLFIVNGNGKTICFDILNYNEIWSRSLGDLGRGFFDRDTFLTSFLSSSDDLIFNITNDGFLAALKQSDGSKVWSLTINHPFRSPFKYDDGILYGVSSSNKVFAINAADGSILWQYENSGTTKVTMKKPAVLLLENAVLASFSTSEAIAFDKKSGKILWIAEVNHKDGDNMFRLVDIESTPAKINDNYIMIGGINGNIQFFNSYTGQIVSGYFGSLSSGIAAIDDFVFFIDRESRLICFHIPSGAVKWFVTFKNRDIMPIPAYLNAGKNKISIGYEYLGPILINDNLAVFDQFGHLFIIDPENGEIKKEVKVEKDIYANPIIVGGKIYLVDDKFGNIVVL